MEVVGAEVQLELRRLGGIEVNLCRSLVLLEPALIVVAGLCCGERGLRHGLFGDEDGAEELVLEGNPLKRFLDVLGFVARLAEVLHTLFLTLVGEGAVAVLEVGALLLLQDGGLPVEEQGGLSGHRHAFQALRRDVHVEHVGIGTKRVAHLQLLSLLVDGEGDAVVCLLGDVEREVSEAEILLLEGQGQLHRSFFFAENHDVALSAAALVADDFSVFHDGTLAVEGHFDLSVLEDDALPFAIRFAITFGKEEGGAVGSPL